MMPINGASQNNFSSGLSDLLHKTTAKAASLQEQQQPQMQATAPVRTETEAANIAYSNTVEALEFGQQPSGQTGHALDPARVAALLDL
ncbi:MAG: hypothetical protein MI749_20255 [Desulfovibrionales bacterium]|nr:hypothetical protein [Desulfovibrionales bacterium]